MQINLFNWVRQGVRQSVLLGVADAVDDLGSPEGDTKFSKSIREVVKQSAIEAGFTGNSTAGRRRLGKSLKEIEGTGKKS